MNYEPRVAKGAAELDRILPGWERKIDLERLNLASGCNCVLGQLSVDLTGHNHDPDVEAYEQAIDHLYPEKYTPQTKWATERGFALLQEPFTFSRLGRNAWKELTEAWKRLIRQRLEA